MGLFDRLRGKPTPTPARQARQARPAVGQHVGGLQHHPALGHDNRGEARDAPPSRPGAARLGHQVTRPDVLVWTPSQLVRYLR